MASIIQELKHVRDPPPLHSQILEVRGNNRKLQAQEEPQLTNCEWSYIHSLHLHCLMW